MTFVWVCPSIGTSLPAPVIIRQASREFDQARMLSTDENDKDVCFADNWVNTMHVSLTTESLRWKFLWKKMSHRDACFSDNWVNMVHVFANTESMWSMFLWQLSQYGACFCENSVNMKLLRQLSKHRVTSPYRHCSGLN